jgi:preprotein translocase subunit SecF
MIDKEKLEKFHDKNYKKLLLIPLFLLIISFVLIGIKIKDTGDFINKDISLKGGITLTVYTDKVIDINDLGSSLSKETGFEILVRKLTDFSTGKQIGLIIEAAKVEDKNLEEQEDSLKNSLKSILGVELTSENYSIEVMGSSLGESFYKEMLIALLVAFLFMGIVVFITFRTFIPSIAVIFSALFDITMTLGVLNLFNMKLSAAGIAAFLMILGYAIDTDILLTTRMIKRKEGTVFSRILNAGKTGLTMSLTTICALTVAFVFTNSPILKQMFLIILIGLSFDLISTWINTCGILKWYLEKKNKLE